MTLTEWVDLGAKAGGLVVLLGAPMVGAYRYFQTRAFAPKLEIAISGQTFTLNGNTYLSVEVRMKNFGASRVGINPDPSYVAIWAMEAVATPHTVVPRHLFELLDIFNHQNWLEAGESADDFLLIKLDHGDYLGFYIEVSVVSLARWTPFKRTVAQRRGREWLRNATINCKLKPEGANSS